ncbi:hypothetical protein ABE607_08405, partial [Comamonas aquatica]|uniref:hypothetical protein n=1 Tax=Comamonas aquatica TaxID=225991 RepID=UPI00320AE63D
TTIAPMKPSAAFPRLSIVSKCSPTSTSDWCRNSRGLHNDSIEISLISPVFRERKYKWRGLVEDSVINFKISDRKFNKLIKDTKFPFRDGDVIQCAIKTKGEVDYFGDWVKKEIFITKVHALVTKGKTYTFSGNEIISTGNSAHESQYNQGNLFEDDDFFDINRTEI